MIPRSFTSRVAVGLLVTASFLSVSMNPVLAHGKKNSAKAAAASAPQAAAATPAPADMIPALQAQLKATPNDSSIALRLAEAYLQVDHPDLAQTICAHLISSGVKSMQVYFFNGVALRELGHVNEAITSLETASNLDPTAPLVLLELTNAYLQANRIDDAYRVAKRASTFNGKDPRVALNYGVVLAVQKQFDAARAQFAIAANLEPNDPLPQILTARTYLDQNQLGPASALYDTILSKNPSSVAALQGKVRIALAEHNTNDAIAFDEHLLALAPDDASKVQILNEEARIYIDAKHQDQADATLRREVTLFPNLELAHISYGDLNLSEGKERDAVAQWAAGLGPNQDGRIALSRLGMYALRKNDPQNAVRMFGRLTQLNASDDAAWFHLGQGYQMLNKFDRARDAFRHAFSIRQTVQAFADIGSCDYELRNYQEGARIFDQLIAQAPAFVNTNPNLLFIVAKTYEHANQTTKARSAYYRILAFVKPGSNDEKTVRSLIAQLNKPNAGATHGSNTRR